MTSALCVLFVIPAYVTPAKAGVGIHLQVFPLPRERAKDWIPACAGMTSARNVYFCHSRYLLSFPLPSVIPATFCHSREGGNPSSSCHSRYLLSFPRRRESMVSACMDPRMRGDDKC